MTATANPEPDVHPTRVVLDGSVDVVADIGELDDLIHHRR